MNWVAVLLVIVVVAGAGAVVGPKVPNEILALVSGAVGSAVFLVDQLTRSRKAITLDDVAEMLARAVRKQWEEADERDGLADQLPLRFSPADPAHGLSPAWEDLLRFRRDAVGRVPPEDGVARDAAALRGELPDIAAVLGRTPSGRLVVLGRGGAGKSVLARHLTLLLLRDRGPKDPVPLLVQLSSWEPSTERFLSWTEGQLSRALEMSGAIGGRRCQEMARRLIDDHRVILVLDGLDEVSGSLRAAAMSELNISRAARGPLVVTCRTEEYRQAVATGEHLAGAAVVEIENLASTDVAAYLRAPGGLVAARWEPVVTKLNGATSDGPLADVLTTPLYVTLARAIYAPRARPDPLLHRFFRRVRSDDGAEAPDPVELLERKRFVDGEAIKAHLLGVFVAAAYRGPDPDGRPSPWTIARAERCHAVLAGLMADLGAADLGATDLAWWEIWRETPSRLRSLAFGIAAGLVVAVGYTLALATASAEATVLGTVSEGLILGIVAGTGASLAMGTRVGRPPKHPREGAGGRPARLVPVLLAGVLGSAIVGVLFELALVNGIILLDASDTPIVPGLILSLVMGGGFVAGLVGGTLLLDLVAPDAVQLERTVDPRKVLVRDRTVFVVFGLIAWPLVVVVAAVIAMLLWGVTSQFLTGPASGGELGTALGFMVIVGSFGLFGVGLVWGWTRASWAFFALARIWLAARGRLPWRLMKFLDDGVRRGVLSQVGPYYQFRHIDLQRQLTAGRERRIQPRDPAPMIDAVRGWRTLPRRLPAVARGEFHPDPSSAGERLTVMEAFERAHRRLAITGEPGSGRTTAARELIEQLLDAADAAPGAGVPELFMLASWPRRQGSLSEWLEDELRQRGLDPTWWKEDRLIPVLDGLEEVDEQCRDACLTAIRDGVGRRAVVVICGRDEYRRLTATSLEPPLGDYHLPHPPDHPKTSDALPVRLVWDAFLRTDLEPAEYPASKVRWWLGWLAAPAVQHAEIWPHRFPPPPTRIGSPHRRQALASGVVCGAIVGVGTAMLLGTLRAIDLGSVPWAGLLAVSLVVHGLLFGAAGGLLPGSTYVSGPIKRVRRVTGGLVYALVFWLAGVLTSVVSGWLLDPAGVSEGTSPGPLTAVGFGLLIARAGGIGVDPSGAPTWSVSLVRPSLGLGLVAGLLAVLVMADPEVSPLAPLTMALVAVVAVATVTGLVRAVPASGRPVDRPTWWTASAARSGAVFGLVAGAGMTLCVILYWLFLAVLSGEWQTGTVLARASAWGLFGLTSVGTVFGWAAVSWNVVLRVRCWFQGVLPARPIAFLEWCADQGYLRRCGGCFQWAHPGLARYLAASSGYQPLPPRSATPRGPGRIRVPVVVLVILACLLVLVTGVFTLGAIRARQEDSSALTLRGHTDVVRAVTLTPDGTQIVTASEDTSIRVWDVATGRQIRVLTGHRHTVAAVVVTPDGRRMISSSYDDTVRVWDLATGRQLRVLDGDPVHVYALAIAPDGRRLVGGAVDGTVRVWDPVTGRQLHVLRGSPGDAPVGAENETAVMAVAVTPDGRQAVSCGQDRTVRVWDLKTAQLARVLHGHTYWVHAVAVGPDGRTVVSGDFDRTLRVWDLATGRQLRVLTGHVAEIRGASIAADGRTLVTGSSDRTLRVWDLSTGRQLRTLRGHNGDVTAVVITADGRTAVSASHDTTVRVWRW